MKWTALATIIVGLLTLTIFQNCAPSHNEGDGGVKPFDVTKVYPYYDAKPEYFNNVQLTKVFEDAAGVWKYQFVASAVLVDDADKDIDVDIKILDQDDKLLCLGTRVRVNSSSNHIMIDNCSSGLKATLIKIKVFIKLATQSAYPTAPTSSYLFPLAL